MPSAIMYPPIYILATPNGMALGVTTPLDILHTTNLLIRNMAGDGAAKLRWRIVSEDGKPVRMASGICIEVDGRLDDIQGPGWLIVTGAVVENSRELAQFLKQQSTLLATLPRLHQDGLDLAATCTGTFLLAECGLLDGLQATTTWWLSDDFRQNYPAVELCSEQLITINQRILCAGTATAHFELMLHLVRTLVGPKYAHLCAKYLLLDTRTHSQAPYQKLTPNVSNTPFIENAMQWIKPRINDELRIDELAQALTLSPRTLIRRFKETTGGSPLQFIQKMRIEKSKNLLETSRLTTEDIMQRVGYQDDSTFRRLFKRHTGLTPNQYRQRFAMKR